MPWRTIDGDEWPRPAQPELGRLVRGMFDQRRLLDLIRHFVVFEDDGGEVAKKMAAYHQYHAVNKAVAVHASRPPTEGDRRIGVVWHTQGCGKSLSMAFYSGQDHPAPGDGEPDPGRADRPQRPGRPALRHLRRLRGPAAPDARPGREPRDLRELLKVAAGRRGLHHDPEVHAGRQGRQLPAAVRPAQHRGHRRRGPPQPVRLHRRLRPAPAGRPAQRLVHRLHRHAHRERPTRARRPSSATTSTLRHPAGRRGRRHGPIYYEGRLAKIELREAERPKIDPEFEEVTEGEEDERKEKLKSNGPGWRRWSARRSGSRWSPRTWSTTSRSALTPRWTARR